MASSLTDWDVGILVTTVNSSTDVRYAAPPGSVFDGVVLIRGNGFAGSGALLFDGRAVLTAAHVAQNVGASASVTFQTESGSWTQTLARASVHPEYDPRNSNNDLALLWLAAPAPASATRYELYRNGEEIGQNFSLAGFGQNGSGASGSVTSPSGTLLRLKAENRFDADGAFLKSVLGGVMAWSPKAQTHLVADFDDGTVARDALGRLASRSDLGRGVDEGLIAPGDSGGPALIGGRLAGVASYTASLSTSSVQPDVDSEANSSYGEVAAWMRVGAFQQWIDQSIRANYPDVPSQPSEVKLRLVEGNSGVTYAYFLLQFKGVRANAEQVLSVDYATRDGTALAGSDYIPLSGRLNLYPGDNQAVIPVEVLGDSMAEADETFYLDVFNPVGGSFPDGLVQLTAVRTILDDDGLIG